MKKFLSEVPRFLFFTGKMSGFKNMKEYDLLQVLIANSTRLRNLSKAATKITQSSRVRSYHHFKIIDKLQNEIGYKLQELAERVEKLI